MQRHCIKLDTKFFGDVVSGVKTFELRYDDRGYQVGDVLEMSEVLNGDLTGRVVRVAITYKLSDYPGLEENYCILGIEHLGGVK